MALEELRVLRFIWKTDTQRNYRNLRKRKCQKLAETGLGSPPSVVRKFSKRPGADSLATILPRHGIARHVPRVVTADATEAG